MTNSAYLGDILYANLETLNAIAKHLRQVADGLDDKLGEIQVNISSVRESSRRSGYPPDEARPSAKDARSLAQITQKYEALEQAVDNLRESVEGYPALLQETKRCAYDLCVAMVKKGYSYHWKPEDVLRAAFGPYFNPTPELRAVIGAGPMSRNAVVERLWVYIKENRLQKETDRRMIQADAVIKPVFEKDEVSMFELAAIVSKHMMPAPDRQ